MYNGRTMDMLSQTLEGGYYLARLIAEGRSCQVYEAERSGSSRPVVVKLLHPVLADDPERVRRFCYEGDVLRRLRHRNAVGHVESVQNPGGHCFHVLELLQGETLRRRLDRAGPLPSKEVARLVKQAAAALQALHDLGVVHRGVEPSNLFLTVQPDATVELKLLDLGEALDLGNRQRAHEVVGSKGYISPEQFRGKVLETTAAADIFALAVVAYEALCNRLPFEADDDADLLYEVSSGSFPSASGRVEGLPPQVDAVFSRAMHPDRDQRHHSIETFADELVDAIKSGDPRPRKVGSDTARMKAVPAPVPDSTSLTGARIPAPATAPAAEASGPTAPARPSGPPAARVPVPPVPVVIPGLPLVDPSAASSAEQSPDVAGAFLTDKTVVDAAPPAAVLQPIRQAVPTVAQPEQVQVAAPAQPVQTAAAEVVQPVPPAGGQEQTVQSGQVLPEQPAPALPPAASPPQVLATPYVPAPGATPYVPPAIPHMGSASGLPPAWPAGPPPASVAVVATNNARSGGPSVALIVVAILVGVLGLGLLLALYLFLR